MMKISIEDKTYSPLNSYKVSNSIIYLEQLDKLQQAREKPFLYKYYFGAGKSEREIKETIIYWFNSCVGAYNNINETYHNENDETIMRLIKNPTKLMIGSN